MNMEVCSLNEHMDTCRKRVKWSTSNNTFAPEADPNPYVDTSIYYHAVLSCDISVVCLHLTSTLNKEALCSSETLVHAYQTTWCYNRP
jgi:hypothetical protein